MVRDAAWHPSGRVRKRAEYNAKAGDAAVKARKAARAKAKKEKAAALAEEEARDPGKAARVKKEEREKKAALPKRKYRYRKKCPVATMERAERVISQRMFMIDREVVSVDPEKVESFSVLGSTGNVYTVSISSVPSCDCPDFQKGNAPCKHVIFVFLKVLKVPMHSLLWFQRDLTPDELGEIYREAPDADTKHVAVPEVIRESYLKATGRAPKEKEIQAEVAEATGDSGPGSKRLSAIGEDCPVCYDEMTAEDNERNKLVFDLSMVGCGRPIHAECFNTWKVTRRRQGHDITCVWCNGKWAEEIKAGSGAGPSYSQEGYLNLADEMGISRVRDTSTYYHGRVYSYY